MNEEIVKELKEQTKWLRFLAVQQLKTVIEKTLTTTEQRRMYDLSDGSSTSNISKKLLEEGIKVSHMTVYNYWKRWFSLGIVIPSEKYQGRFEKIINLEDLNIKD